MRALQRVIDSSAAALDQGAHSASSVDMAVFSGSPNGVNGTSIMSIAAAEGGAAGQSDPDSALHRTAALYDSLATSSSPA